MDTTTHTPVAAASRHRLERPREGRILGGVAAALADRIGIAAGVMRIGFLAAVLFGGFGIVVYAAAWALLPSEDEDNNPAQHWLEDLRTPGTRLGAVLIGIAAAIVLIPFLPAAVIVAAVLVAAALTLRHTNKSSEEA